MKRLIIVILTLQISCQTLPSQENLETKFYVRSTTDGFFLRIIMPLNSGGDGEGFVSSESSDQMACLGEFDRIASEEGKKRSCRPRYDKNDVVLRLKAFECLAEANLSCTKF